jgi:outer membrane protein OmpA-like peptidoglycan-associated protein
MRTPTLALLALSLAFAPPAHATQRPDNPKCKDSQLFTRMPGSYIYNCDHKSFDSFDFPVSKKDKVTVEGKREWITYYPQPDVAERPSDLQIIRNFENAMKRIGGTIVYSEKSRSTMKLEKDGKELWVHVTAEFTGKYGFNIVEKQAMAQDVVADAAAFAADLGATGHAAVYGIHFDTGKAEIRPESANAIAEIAKLLARDPGLSLYVVGHTDMVGGADSNLKLSRDRADAVVRELVRAHAVAPARLTPFGAGPYAPVESNRTEEGRAKNRRVELVAR